jgi:Lariat debranching enzyme, C-terminal domain
MIIIRFIALDKALPKRKFIHILQYSNGAVQHLSNLEYWKMDTKPVISPVIIPRMLKYDAEWLSITSVMQPVPDIYECDYSKIISDAKIREGTLSKVNNLVAITDKDKIELNVPKFEDMKNDEWIKHITQCFTKLIPSLPKPKEEINIDELL